MNATLTQPNLEEPAITRPRADRLSAVVAPGPRPRARRRPKSLSPGTIAANLVGLALIAILAFAASSLAGQTMMEDARREGLRAQERARKARMDVAALRRHVDRLTSMRAVEHWSEVRRFYAALEAPAEPVTPEIARVARR